MNCHDAVWCSMCSHIALCKSFNRKSIYVSGPISGKLANNFRAFFRASRYVVAFLEGCPVNPLEIYQGKNTTWLEFMRTDIKALVDCEEIVMLPGWLWSRGARIEFMIALFLGIRVRFLSEKICGK